jgi:hypothetical protein
MLNAWRMSPEKRTLAQHYRANEVTVPISKKVRHTARDHADLPEQKLDPVDIYGTAG